MGTAPTPVLISATGTGNSSDGTITRDAIDDLIGAMSSKLLIYLRAKKITPANSSFIDALGNTVTAKTTGVTKNNSDSNFNNHPSITFANNNNQYAMAAGGIGIGTPPQAMTNSFTVLAGIRAGTITSSLYGDNAATSDSNNTTGFYLNSAGNFVASIGASSPTLSGTQPLLSPSTTGVVWFSYDSATNIIRAGVNSATVQLTATSSVTRTGAGTGTLSFPFGYQTSGASGNQQFNRWTLWNKAFMNGSVAADDAAFTNLITQYAAYI